MLVDNGRILLGKRSQLARSHHGQWDVIGGHIESGESDKQALLRELEEELSIVPKSYKAIGVFCEMTKGYEYHLSIYSINEWDGVLTNCSNEHDELRWFSPVEIEKLDLTSRTLIPEIARKALRTQ